MKTIKQRRKEFLDEMVSYYSEDTSRRSVNEYNGDCMYRTKDGKKCAIGRYIPDNLYDPSIEHQSLTLKICRLLPANIQKLRFEFLSEVQELHDNEYYWDKNSLSPLGMRKYKEIIKDHIS